VPVDRDGLDLDALASTDAAAVVVTPAHQFPTGAVLARGRRTALLDWAEQNDRLIIEDDYDAELRYDGIAVGALQGLAPERVLYIGSASKRLAPALRLAWMQLPTWLTGPLVSAKSVEDGGAEILGQLALADFMTRGELDRHLRRMRRATRHAGGP
jgi:GntR family transcriptional regulator / MocR family aminotransferase